MGQKVNPIGMRLGIVRDWTAKWYAEKNFADYLNADLAVRKFLIKKLKNAAVSHIQIERPANNARVTIYSARPGVILGKKGSDLQLLQKQVSKITKMPTHLKIEEIRKPDLNATLVAQNIAQQLERRVMFRRAMKRAMQSTMRQGAEGVKIMVSGRLNGADIARSECYREGRVPLHTFRADIDYASERADTTYGVIGVKVWIFKGEKTTMNVKKKAGEKKPTGKEG